MNYRMSWFIVLMLGLFFVTSVQAEVYQAGGEIELKEAMSSFDKENVTTVSIGEDVKLTASFYIDDFFDRKIINAGAQLHNTTSDTMHCSYNVAFFDEDKKLVGCTSQNGMSDGLGPNEESHFGSCLISLPHAVFEKVKFYQITFYTGKKQVGKE